MCVRVKMFYHISCSKLNMDNNHIKNINSNVTLLLNKLHVPLLTHLIIKLSKYIYIYMINLLIKHIYKLINLFI